MNSSDSDSSLIRSCIVELESIIKFDPDTYKKVPWIISNVQFEARRKDLFTIDSLKKFMLIWVYGTIGAFYESKDLDVTAMLPCMNEGLCFKDLSVVLDVITTILGRESKYSCGV